MNNSLTIQEYALYLGAPCKVKKYRLGKISAVGHVAGQDLIRVEYANKNFWESPPESVTMILRHLDSLTEAEARELYLLTEGKEWEFIVVGVDQPCLYCWWKWYDDRPNSRLIGNSIVWRWLLAHHFDLFGWIEAGLALDGSNVKTIV